MRGVYLGVGVVVCAVGLLASCTRIRRPVFAPYPGVPSDRIERPSAEGVMPGLAAPAPGQSLQAWTSTWMTGPVSVIATRRERALYSKLAPSKRARFVELFWRRRDPDLSTRRNEYLEEFSTRWAAAERYFGSSGGPGWRTAFGTVLLVFGIPDQVEFVPPPRPVPSRSADRDELLEQNSVSDGVAVRFYYRGSETVPGSARRTRGPNGPFERLDPHIVFTYWHGSWRAGCRPADPQPEPVDLGTVPVIGPDDGGTYSRGRGWQQVAGCPELSELLRELMETEVRASLRNPPGYEVLASRP